MVQVVLESELRKIMPMAGKRIPIFLEPLNLAMEEFEINNILRQAAFLAQIAHESGELKYVKELASGEAYDTGRLAAKLGNTPDADGDGQKYKGRGLIQLTGRNNYRDCGIALGLDLLSEPELLEQPINACRSAGWFWKSHGLNELADVPDFIQITKIINGGFNGWEHRQAYYAIALVNLNPKLKVKS